MLARRCASHCAPRPRGKSVRGRAAARWLRRPASLLSSSCPIPFAGRPRDRAAKTRCTMFRSNTCREHETLRTARSARWARSRSRAGRKTVHRGRLCFIRAAALPCAALQVRWWRATGDVPGWWMQSCAWAGCGANQAQALAAGDTAAQYGHAQICREVEERLSAPTCGSSPQ